MQPIQYDRHPRGAVTVDQWEELERKIRDGERIRREDFAGRLTWLGAARSTKRILTVLATLALFVGWLFLFTPVGPMVADQLGWHDEAPPPSWDQGPVDCLTQPWDARC